MEIHQERKWNLRLGSKDAKLKEATVDYIYLPKMGDCKTALGVRLSNEN